MPPLRLLASYATQCLVLVAVVAISNLTAFADEGDTSPVSDGAPSEVTYNSFLYLPLVGIGAPGTAEKYPADNRGYELELLRLINEQRAAAGVASVEENVQLTQAARRHARDMAAHDWLSHTGTDGSNPGQRMMQEGYTGTSWGEAIGYRTASAQSMFDWWMNSIPHRGIILDPLAKEMGIGYSFNPAGEYKTTWVVDTGH